MDDRAGGVKDIVRQSLGAGKQTEHTFDGEGNHETQGSQSPHHQKAMKAYVENIECLRVSTYAKKYVKEQIEENG